MVKTNYFITSALTELISRGRIKITRKEKNHEMKTEMVAKILCSAQLLYLYIKKADNKKVVIISNVKGQSVIIGSIFNFATL